jgi:cytidine deaminase
MRVADIPRVSVEALTEMQYLAVQEALRVQEHAYAPYSRYKVGAAVVTPLCHIFSGVNVENHVYLVPHAEMNACAAMCAAGERQFIVLVCAAKDNGIPCGICLQITREWAGPDLSKTIVIGVSTEDPTYVTRCTFEEALQITDAFGPESLGINPHEH